MASIINESMKIINKTRYNFLKNIFNSFLYIYSLRFKLKVLPRGILSLIINMKVDSRLISIPLSYRFDMPKNYKSYYSSRRNSIFPGKSGIGSSFLFVLDCGYTEIPFCDHFINHPTQKVNSFPNHRDYIININMVINKRLLYFWLYFWVYLKKCCVVFNYMLSYH